MLIIGYGNPLRGDDAFGFVAAARIPGAIALHQLLPELMEPISRADCVVFLDACADGEPGEIRRRNIEPGTGEAGFTHHITPESLLAGARALYGRAPQATLITVCGAHFELFDALSAPVQSALDVILLDLRA